MRVLLCGGGTSGHVMPAIAMGEIIEKHFPGAVIAFGGRCGGDENRAYTKSGHKLYTVDIQGLRRSLTVNNVKSIIKVIKSSRNALEIIKDFKPDIIIGTGGYVCYPFLSQGRRMGIRTMMHESNVYPGLVTRLLYKRCDAVMLNLEGTMKYLRGAKNAVVVGNPIRSGFGSISKADARRRLGIRNNEVLIVSFGGSLGATVLNRAIAELISRYTKSILGVRHMHSTGRSHYEEMKKAYPELFLATSNAKIVPFIEDMPLWLTAADIAITRSGAITISELCRSATPSILIPSPNVTANHQYVNAEYMQEIGASVLVSEESLDSEKLYREVISLMKDKDRLSGMSERAREACEIDTEQRIVCLIREVMKRGEK